MICNEGQYGKYKKCTAAATVLYSLDKISPMQGRWPTAVTVNGTMILPWSRLERMSLWYCKQTYSNNTMELQQASSEGLGGAPVDHGSLWLKKFPQKHFEANPWFHFRARMTMLIILMVSLTIVSEYLQCQSWSIRLSPSSRMTARLACQTDTISTRTMGLYLYTTICSTLGTNNYMKIRTDNYTWIDILVSFSHSTTVSTHFQGNLHNITSNKPPNNDVPWPCVSGQFQITHFLKDPHKHCISIAVPYKSQRITVKSYTKTFSCVTICQTVLLMVNHNVFLEWSLFKGIWIFNISNLQENKCGWRNQTHVWYRIQTFATGKFGLLVLLWISRP